MRDGFRFSFAANEFSVAAIAIALLAGTVGYEYTHRTYPPVPPPAPAEACTVKEPTITIEQTFYIPVPVQVAPKVSAPDPEIAPKEEDDADPVFEHRQVIVTKALQTPMSEMARN